MILPVWADQMDKSDHPSVSGIPPEYVSPRTQVSYPAGRRAPVSARSSTAHCRPGRGGVHMTEELPSGRVLHRVTLWAVSTRGRRVSGGASGAGDDLGRCCGGGGDMAIDQTTGSDIHRPSRGRGLGRRGRWAVVHSRSAPDVTPAKRQQQPRMA